MSAGLIFGMVWAVIAISAFTWVMVGTARSLWRDGHPVQAALPAIFGANAVGWFVYLLVLLTG
ncbi:MAG TPA: hypothetical protein VFA05_04360 [Gaiellaceae bacterium]|nr:hypothetical protein [Gaiellaceae bacterium]